MKKPFIFFKTKLLKSFKIKLLKSVAAIISALALSLVFANLAACKNQTDYFCYVSELRSNVYFGEDGNFALTVYSGLREKPFNHDGEAGEHALTLTFKLFMKEKVNEAVKLKYQINGANYQTQLAYDATSSALSCVAEVSALPETPLDVTVFYGENAVLIKTASLLNEDTITYLTALKNATDKAADFIKQNSESSRFKGEISVRLLCENGRNYYYVGFILKDGLKLAYLLDGKSGEILAEKKL